MAGRKIVRFRLVTREAVAMINENTQPGRKNALQGAIQRATMPSDWLRLMLRSGEPARRLVEQWFLLTSQAFPLWTECQRSWERWAHAATENRWANPAAWWQTAWGPWNMWLGWAGMSGPGGRPLSESVEDLRRQVAALRRDLDRYQARATES
jgi:hypothetical protein